MDITSIERYYFVKGIAKNIRIFTYPKIKITNEKENTHIGCLRADRN